MLLEHWFLIFFLPCSAFLILVLEWHASEQEVGGGLQWRGNKEPIKWRGMSFRESQHGIVFNPWICGSPRMPSSLLSLLQRQGIKDTLHLFHLAVLWGRSILQFRTEISLCLFCALGLKSWIFQRFSLCRCIIVFSEIIVSWREFLLLYIHSGNNIAYFLYHHTSNIEFEARFRFWFIKREKSLRHTTKHLYKIPLK